MRLRNEQPLPRLEAESVDGRSHRLPAEIDDGWAVVLFYRGHW